MSLGRGRLRVRNRWHGWPLLAPEKPGSLPADDTFGGFLLNLSRRRRSQGRMDPTDIAPMLDKVEFKCGASLPETVRTSVFESFQRVLRHYPEIVRLNVEVSDPEMTNHGVVFLAKGTVELGGPDIHTSVVSEQVPTAIDFLLENVSRQLRRRRRFKPVEKNAGSIFPSLPAA